MAKWNPLALKILMWFMGLLIVAGSAMGFIGSTIFNFDSNFGITASVAGIAFGAGLMIAGFDPIANVSFPQDSGNHTVGQPARPMGHHVRCRRHQDHRDP